MEADSATTDSVFVLLPSHSYSFNVSGVPQNARVAELKDAISKQCPGRPNASGQRIIAQGRVLGDDESVVSPVHPSDTLCRIQECSMVLISQQYPLARCIWPSILRHGMLRPHHRPLDPMSFCPLSLQPKSLSQRTLPHFSPHLLNLLYHYRFNFPHSLQNSYPMSTQMPSESFLANQRCPGQEIVKLHMHAR